MSSFLLAGEPRPRTRLDKIGASIDRLIGVISPKRRFEREQYRLGVDRLSRMRAASASSAYEGARPDRQQNWRTTSGSADADLDPESLASLRERSRDRVRNDAVAAAAIGAMADNIVGTGLRPQLQLPFKQLGITETKSRELAEIAGDLWREWGTRCDSTGRLTIDDAQNLAISQVCVNGDLLVQPLMIDRTAQRRRLELSLEFIEADRCDSPNGIESSTLRHGIELDAKIGEPKAYWICEAHPGDEGINGFSGRSQNWRRIPAYTPTGRPRILHLAGVERPGQSRGRPLMSPVLNLFKQRDDFGEATIMAAQIAACFAAFVTKNDPMAAALARATSDTRGKKDREEELSPGMITYLGLGEDVRFGTPTQPSGTFDSFMHWVTRELCSALGMSYEVATRDFSNTTYSQARAALLEARRMFARRQIWLVAHFLQPIWTLLLEEAWLKGLFPAGNDFLEQIELWTRAHWITPGWGLLDPLKEAQADEIRLRMGVTTRAKIISGHDGDAWEDTFAQLAREKSRQEELGIAPVEQTPGAAAPQQEEMHGDEKDEQGDEEGDDAEPVDEPKELEEALR